MPVHRGHLGLGVLGRRPDHRHPLPRRPLRVEPACFQVREGPGERQQDLGRPPGGHMAIKRRSHRHQDVPGQEPERRRPHEQARQSPVASGAANQADGRRDHQAEPRRQHQDRQADREDRVRVPDLRGGQCRRQAEDPQPGTPNGEDPSSQHRQTHGQEVTGTDV